MSNIRGTGHKEIIAKRVDALELNRASWKSTIDQNKTKGKMSGKGDSRGLEAVVFDIYQSRQAPTFTDVENGKMEVKFEVLDTTWLKNESPANGQASDERVKPSDECFNNVLKGLGVIQNNENFGDLRMLPSSSDAPNGPRYSYQTDRVDGIPTNIPNTTATLFLKENRVAIGMGVDTLDKIVDFPASA